ncbi:hypothetical protein AVEN_185805-1, partial [Araneus ventricosus]
INPCETGNGGCEQKCLYVDKRLSCGCEPDFILQPDGRSCKGGCFKRSYTVVFLHNYIVRFTMVRQNVTYTIAR